MITKATIGYRLPGDREQSTATFPVAARTEAEAFDQAVRKLQLHLITQVLDLRPWAETYDRRQSA